jgi:hypothetical protein
MADKRIDALTGHAANLKLFINAANNAPEWAAGIAVKSIVRAMADASGDVAYTSIGFKPAAIYVQGSGAGMASFGFALGIVEYCTIYYPSGWNAGANYICVFYEDAGATKGQSAIVKSMDADGFTLTWTKIGSPTVANVQLFVLAFR